MKRFFISAIVTMGCFMAHAQSVTIPEVSIVPGGEKSVDVTIAEGTKYTAFQFDVALPKGVSLKSASFKGKGETREITSGTVDGKYRVLSYDTKNEKLGESEVLSLTFEATDEFTADAETAVDGIVIVDPEGNSATTTNGTVAIKVAQGLKITVPDGKKLMMVSDEALDFSSLESKGVKAYICTGYEVVGEKNRFWLTRVDDVPANTPIMVKAETAGEYTVPIAVTSFCYPKSFLSGDATKATTVDYTADFKYFGVSKSTGNIGAMSAKNQPTVDAGKAFFQVPATIASNVASGKQEFTLGDGGRLATVSDYDLDFSSLEAAGVKAYTVTGFDKGRKVWMTQVSNVNAGTPFVLRGSKAQKCEVPSVAGKAAYVNMLDANTGTESITVTPTIGEYTVYALSLGKGTWGTLAKDWSAAKGKAWMLVPTAFHNSLPASVRGEGSDITEEEAEVICIEVRGIGTLVDDEITGISRVESEVVNDVWYNLKGQRIDAPTKKGLYIKNGKKVVVK